MSVKYRKVVNNRKGSTTKGKIYGRAVVSDVVNTKQIAEKITQRCTVTEPDVLAVINALETEIASNLAQSNRVVLDGFGSFKVGLTTAPADTAKKFTSNNIKGMHVIFQPYTEMDGGKRIKPMLRGVKTEEMTEYEGLKDAQASDPGTDPGSGTDPDSGSKGDNPSGGGSSNPGGGSGSGGGSAEID